MFSWIQYIWRWQMQTHQIVPAYSEMFLEKYNKDMNNVLLP